jgi:hypothetical protein
MEKLIGESLLLMRPKVITVLYLSLNDFICAAVLSWNSKVERLAKFTGLWFDSPVRHVPSILSKQSPDNLYWEPCTLRLQADQP